MGSFRAGTRWEEVSTNKAGERKERRSAEGQVAVDAAGVAAGVDSTTKMGTERDVEADGPDTQQKIGWSSGRSDETVGRWVGRVERADSAQVDAGLDLDTTTTRWMARPLVFGKRGGADPSERTGGESSSARRIGRELSAKLAAFVSSFFDAYVRLG